MRATATADFSAHLNGRRIAAKSGQTLEVTEREFGLLRGLLKKARQRKPAKEEEVIAND